MDLLSTLYHTIPNFSTAINKQDLKAGALVKRIDDNHCSRINSLLMMAKHCLDDAFVGKQPLAWEE